MNITNCRQKGKILLRLNLIVVKIPFQENVRDKLHYDDELDYLKKKEEYIALPLLLIKVTKQEVCNK